MQSVDFYINGTPDAPILSAMCREALESCGPLSRPPTGHAARYFFPPPWILSPPDPKKRNQFVHNYIRIRDYCICRHFTENFQDLPKKTEYWKEALKGNYCRSVNVDSKTASIALITKNDSLPPSTSVATEGSKRPQRKLIRAIARTEFGCNGELQPWDKDMVVVWQGKNLTLDNVDCAQLREEVQYELYEMNWRSELLALDLLVTHTEDSPIDHISQRKERVGHVWNANSTGVILFPDMMSDYTNVWVDHFTDDDKSRDAIRNLYRVLYDWPEFPPDLCNKDVDSMSNAEVNDFAKSLFQFYCKIFMQHFFRLPILPRSLSK